ncbi:hypothetical protein [Aneurinibacillus tyrosinisolvens]|uniref:hypothetical protein n=1 Tax=Aneurinibacillus tyrosinisolvens TaxID=1443435 RepID=UPI00063F0C14|nr:hypothetical protein [Aneurinibacillus tyrosinisolvens]
METSINGTKTISEIEKELYQFFSEDNRGIQMTYQIIGEPDSSRAVFYHNEIIGEYSIELFSKHNKLPYDDYRHSELSSLISHIHQRHPNLLYIYDSCFVGGNTEE